MTLPWRRDQYIYIHMRVFGVFTKAPPSIFIIVMDIMVILPTHLKYAFLEENGVKPVVISNSLS